MKLFIFWFAMLFLLKPSIGQEPIDGFNKIFIYQSNWYYNPRHKLSAFSMINSKSSERDSIVSRAKLQELYAAVMKRKRINLLKISDVRMVAVFQSLSGNSDTLLVDVSGKCKFRNSYFMINNRIGILLGVKSIMFNPEEKRAARDTKKRFHTH